MKIFIVNEADEVIDQVERKAITDWSTIIYRASAIWLYNGKGEVLTAQRSPNKRLSPGVWGPSAAGFVESHEDYASNIVKEVEEELGLLLDPSTVTPSLKVLQKDVTSGRRYFMQFYTAPTDVIVSDLHLQTKEVAAARFITPEELLAEHTSHPEQFIDIIPEVFTTIVL